MQYQLKYKITNTKNNLSKIVKNEFYSTKELTKIIFFYQNIGFKLELLNFKKEKGLKDEKDY
ncbi:hypothetical protein K8T27_000400 [Campylobacter upsaliensis]|nr:hypothetical protein [Campylobacter upsaliensis]ELV8019331.1 hypothetical protein [Campylobacter upsaliensis]